MRMSNPGPFTAAALKFEGGEVAYLGSEAERAGSPRLHFAHATGFNALTYRHLLAPLSTDFSIRAWDARGHGRTSLAADPALQTTWDTYADDLVRFLEAWVGPAPLLVGHSMGGTVSLLTAARRPDLAAGVMLLDPPILSETMPPGHLDAPIARAAARRRAVFKDPAEMTAAYRGRGAFKTWPDEILDDYIEGGTRRREDGHVELACAPAFEAATFNGQAHDTWAAIRALKVPALVLAAEHDSTLRDDSLARMCELNPLIRGRIVKGGTHFFPMEQGDHVREAIRAFAAQVFEAA